MHPPRSSHMPVDGSWEIIILIVSRPSTLLSPFLGLSFFKQLGGEGPASFLLTSRKRVRQRHRGRDRGRNRDRKRQRQTQRTDGSWEESSFSFPGSPFSCSSSDSSSDCLCLLLSVFFFFFLLLLFFFFFLGSCFTSSSFAVFLFLLRWTDIWSTMQRHSMCLCRVDAR